MSEKLGEVERLSKRVNELGGLVRTLMVRFMHLEQHFIIALGRKQDRELTEEETKDLEMLMSAQQSMMNNVLGTLLAQEDPSVEIDEDAIEAEIERIKEEFPEVCDDLYSLLKPSKKEPIGEV